MSAMSLHPFPARMAPDIAMDWLTGNSADELTILDPMCGSGTVLAAARASGFDAIGVDMDPLAVLMSRVAVTPLNAERLLATGKIVVERANSCDAAPDPWVDPETRRFAEYWFGKPQRQALARLTSAIAAEPAESTRQALLLALSRIIVTKVPRASLAADTSHSRPHRVTTESDYNVIKGYELSIRQLARVISRCPPEPPSARVHLGDARILAPIRDASIDAVITSPPYLNAIDYMRGHKMALIWMGYSIPDLRRIRSESIGAERAPDGDLPEDVQKMITEVRRSVQQPEALPTRILSRYALDLHSFARALHRVVKSNGTVVIVVGNSTVRGNYIRNDRLVETALKTKGFRLERRAERQIPANKRYLPLTGDTASSLDRRMRTEVVLSLRRE